MATSPIYAGLGMAGGAAPTPWWSGIGNGLGRNSDLLLSLGSGLLSGNLAAIPQAIATGAQTDRALFKDYTAEAKAKADENLTKNWIRANRPDLVNLPVNEAFQIAMQKPTGPIKASAGDVFLDPNTLQPLTSIPQAPSPYTLGPQDTRFGPDNQPIATGQPTTKTENAPNGYRYTTDGSLEFIPGGPADPSTAGKTTEATRRNQQLATVIVPELKSLLGDGQTPGTFDALADLGQQTKGAIPGFGNFLTSPEYQQAQNSMRTIVASYLYSVSGATANPGEVENQVSIITPRPGDTPQTVAAKKARLQDMVQAVVAAASGTPISVDASQLPGAQQQPPGGTTSSGVQWSVSP